MIVKLLTEHHLELLISKEGCTGSSESTLVKMPHCWKSHVAAQLSLRVIADISSNLSNIFISTNKNFNQKVRSRGPFS